MSRELHLELMVGQFRELAASLEPGPSKDRALAITRLVQNAINDGLTEENVNKINEELFSLFQEMGAEVANLYHPVKQDPPPKPSVTKSEAAKLTDDVIGRFMLGKKL